MGDINQIANALYEKHKETVDAWLKGSDSYKKALAETLLTAVGVEGLHGL